MAPATDTTPSHRTGERPANTYVGRFAPSPTGPLHRGSLVAALISFLDARTHQGIWRVRIEDLDPPREQPGAAASILRTLDAHALYWDGDVLYQSTRRAAHAEAIATLQQMGWAYACGCTRREIAAAGNMGREGPIYPGTCRHGLPPGRRPRALRVRTHNDPIHFHDRCHGLVSQCLGQEIGDFIIRRADGLTAYQLAVVVDDAFQGITHVVRGSDLLDSTTRQIHLQHLLGLPTPVYLHHALVLGHSGDKLSKQTHAPAVNTATPLANLVQAMAFLGLPRPENWQDATPTSLLNHALAHWSPPGAPA
ncbi:glutamyl-Q tRNA(Asp) synthetase [Ectothiorhodospira magna]|uniref:Glutamyl-Q tRNA(Asp) synthetase n=1 Tax=Ectothiorhodospira magna TaxID=867345 RepID=A0A1H9FWC9_9GAMM|nr:tRNA glutamyl-Q(34) synthetase GluQRS [Ectothiorhodospira magna]SEQ42220.1 glutamyl-Q tRNA(Asp) synthetase [Ectothiorhodospira magna]